jgi:hypothetical protein
MADIEDNVAMAQPAFPRTILLVCAEAAMDFIVNVLNLNGGGEDAVAAQPEDHSRWILMYLLFAGGAVTLGAFCFLMLYEYSWMVCTPVIAVSCILILLFSIGLADSQVGFQDEHHNRLLDFLLQL